MSGGDKLPDDLIRAGTFEDPDTSNIVNDEVASIRVIEAVQRHLEGERDIMEDEENEEGIEDD